MPRLPDTDNRAVRLYLVDITSLHPDVLHNRLLHDDRLLHDYAGGLGYNDWSRLDDYGFAFDNSIRNSTADHAADETRPEITPTRPPEIMMMRRRTMRRRAAMRTRRRTMAVWARTSITQP